MYDIAIIGGGPAALTAGIYATRAGRRTVIFEKAFTGGQAAKAFEIDNYPGFGMISGVELSMKMTDHAAQCGCNIAYEEAVGLDLTGENKTICTTGGEYAAKCVILAMGASPKTLGFEHPYVGSGVSYCATCDGAFFRGKTAAVIGGGNTAVADALYLAKICEKVYLIHRRGILRADKSLQTALLENEKAEILWNCIPKEIIGEGKVEAIVTEEIGSESTRQLATDAVFIAVGQTPQTELIRNTVSCDENGYIITDGHMRTSIDGVFAAGDLRVTPLRQVITAAADGAIAATAASEYLNSAKHRAQ